MNKLPGKIDGRLITKEFFPNSVGRERTINMGECYMWAYIAYKLYSNVDLWTNEGHAFPCQQGKFFDSESPDGVDELTCLTTNRYVDDPEESVKQSEKEFVDYWNTHGRYRFRNVKELDEKVEAYLKR